MRIGIDARELCGHPTGVGRYLSGLLAEWATADAARPHEFVLYAPQPLAITLDTHHFGTRVVPGGSGTWWEQRRLPAAMATDHLDVWFAPGYTSPLFHGVRTVVAIHDVSFAAHPGWFPTREGARRRWLVRQSAAKARAIITISEFSRREIVEHLGVADRMIHVIPPGIAHPAQPAEQAASARVLYVGSIFNRRHVPELIRACGALALGHPAVSLDIVGDNRSFPRQNIEGTISAAHLGDRVRWRKYVGDAELAELYRSARAFAFLSEYEGLGLTPLEAMAAGVPPLLLDTAVARESCGDAAAYVALGEIRSIGHALEQLLFDDGMRRRLLAAAPAVLARYDWPRAARETLAVLESAAS